ncbi:hypothetical protein [Polymorphospora sp. NPDC050346]|uniref:hypothetical protein n=1 Tax=Polymorphospora sp. NPDC050346 TaxID=3155780 RepID=UPI0033C16294
MTRPAAGTVPAAGHRPRAAALLIAAVTGLLAALALAGPAHAHGADTPDGTDYRVRITGVTPAVPGLTVRTIEAGARLELTNHTGRVVEIPGYVDEPYLEIRPDGTYENLNSPTAYRTRTLAGDTPVPAGVDPTGPPRWQRTGTDPVARWHDQRTTWLGADPPPGVRADPTREQRVRDWTVPVRLAGTTVTVTGTLDWVPPPDPWAWWAWILLGTVTIGALGILPGRHAPAATGVLGALCVVGGGCAVAFAVARELDAGTTGAGAILIGLLARHGLPLAVGLFAVAVGGRVLLRRSATDFALVLAGLFLAIFHGAVNAGVLARAVAPAPWPATWARLVIAVAVAVGAGVATAGLLRMHSAARRAPRRPAEPDDAGSPSTGGPTGGDTPTPDTPADAGYANAS